MIKCIDKNIIVEETEDDSNASNIIIKSENNNIFGNVIIKLKTIITKKIVTNLI